MMPERLARRGSAFDRRLLQAARSESPVDGAEERALAALRSAAVGGGLTAAGRTAGFFGAGAVRGKAVAVALAVVTLGPIGIHAILARRATTAPQISAVAVGLERPSPIVVAPPATAGTSGAVDRSVAAADPAGGSAASTPAARPNSSRQSASGLGLEVALMQQATRSLAEADGEAALRALDAYRARCPKRILGQEAGVLRARALLMLGRAAEARALALRLRSADPQGPLAGQLDAIIEGGTAP